MQQRRDTLLFKASPKNEMAVSLVMAREMGKSRFIMEQGEASSLTVVGSQLPLPMK